MPELVANIPRLECFVREKFLSGEDDDGELTQGALWHAVSSVDGRALACLVLLPNGISRDALPITALTTKEHDEHIPLDHAQLWNCPSYEVTAYVLDCIANLRCSVLLKDRSEHQGTYLFTVDWFGTPIADGAGDHGHKSAHIINLDCGCFVAQPNNRILFRDSSFIDPISFEEARGLGHVVNRTEWRVERDDKWLADP